MDKYATLYVKEFFSNHFNSRKNQENINIFVGAFEVINDLVESFASTHSIDCTTIKASDDIQTFSHHLYLNLQTIFEWIEDKLIRSK